MSIFSGIADMFQQLPKTEEERHLLERLGIFVAANLSAVTKLQLIDLGTTKDGGIYFTMKGNKELLERYLKLFPEHKAKAEEALKNAS